MARSILALVAAVALCASLNSPAEAAVKMTRTYVGPAGGSVQQTVRVGARHTNVKTTITRPNGNSVTIRTQR
jgi:hypothetical protein